LELVRELAAMFTLLNLLSNSSYMLRDESSVHHVPYGPNIMLLKI